jgi:STE24 endopeptidase
VLLLALTLGGGLAALLAWTGALALPPLAQDVLLVVAVAVVAGAFGLPFSYWSTFAVEARFGFNRTTRATWVADVAKGTAVAAALGLPLVALVVWLMRAAGPSWWLWAWLAWVGFQFLVLALYPTVIAPLFNKFTPLPDGPAKSAIEALLARCGFASKGLFVMDGSRRSSHGNAFFTGFGRAKRIVLFDTLVDRLAPDQIEAVLAHELGHFRLRHVPKRIAVSAIASAAFLALLAWLASAPWFYEGLGVPAEPGRPGVALVLFVLALPPFAFVLRPLASAWSRRHEFEADAFAAKNASAAALSQALVRLTEDNASTLTPDPVYSAVHHSHPTVAARVARLRAA